MFAGEFTGYSSPVFKADLNDPELIKRIIPTGGTAGMSLIKSTSADYAADWVWFTAVPPYGNVGEVLAKNSNTSGDVGWKAYALPPDLFMGQTQTTAVVAVGGKINFDITMHNAGSITPIGGGTFRLGNGKRYIIEANVTCTFASATGYATFYVYLNGAATGTPISINPATTATHINSANVIQAVITTAATGNHDIDIRLQDGGGTVTVNGYTNFIRIIEVVGTAQGPTGPKGDTGSGVLPSGGTAGQILLKNSVTTGDASWANMPATNFVLAQDTRNANNTPDWYRLNWGGPIVVWELKQRTVVSGPGSSLFIIVMTVIPWGDSSGGAVVQSTTSTTGTRYRLEASGTTWGAWT